MSEINSSLDPVLRADLLSEIRSFLPAFLSSATIERGGPLEAASELLGLPQTDLRRVMAVHILLSPAVRDFVAALPAGIRRPITSSARPRVAGRTVSAGIDWAATARHRATSSPLGDFWVTRPASRIFDIPENRALNWVLLQIGEQCKLARAGFDEKSRSPWEAEIRQMSTAISKARTTAWLQSIPAVWPGPEVYRQLGADRMGFYKNAVTAAARHLRFLLNNPSDEDIVQALSNRYFEPKQDWKLFEIALLMRISRELERTGRRRTEQRLFHDGRKRPFIEVALTSGRVVRAWYQHWPPSTKPSELAEAIKYYGLSSGGNRPDIVIELVDDDIPVRAIILELKASSSSQYLSSGFLQLLGYLRDRPGLTGVPASGWLVAPLQPDFVSKPAEARSLWLVAAHNVAKAVTSTATS